MTEWTPERKKDAEDVIKGVAKNDPYDRHFADEYVEKYLTLKDDLLGKLTDWLISEGFHINNDRIESIARSFKDYFKTDLNGVKALEKLIEVVADYRRVNPCHGDESRLDGRNDISCLIQEHLEKAKL